jgi:hypothetical protein
MGEFKVMIFKSFKHFLQMMHMIPRCEVENIDVINVTFGETKI